MSADWWQNFANNFAADLAPLISLFGESPTKQYLSETLTFLDVFIFSMAPIGVITALVSAIRVAGGPSLRAFIGRAQEGAGIAEVELCSSTSRNVCELYNNGGIARVFGRPKILEFVHDWKLNTPQEQESRDKAGIYSFRDYLSFGHWQEQGADEEKRVAQTYLRKDFAPHPNLSLNVGIKKLHRAWFYLAAILGFALQAGVLAFAALVTYKYPSEFQKDDTQIAVPAFPFVFAGTILLCIGVGICAFIIERSTYERTFERKRRPPSRLYWIQPGDQVVGDQVFDCFAYSDANHPITRYTTSKREIERDKDTKRFLREQSIFVWMATVTTTIGFVLQFLGLRTVHSTVSVAQLGAMLIMSMVRALLRTRHLKEEHNLLGDSSTLYLHHELDWLAIEMALENQEDFARGLLGHNRKQKPFWRITGPDRSQSLSVPRQRIMYEKFKDKAVKAYLKRVKLAQMTGAQTLASTLIVDDPWEDVMVSSRIWALKLACAIEGVMDVISRRCTVKDTLRQAQIPWSLRCWMGSASKTWEGNSSKNIIQLTISHETEGTGLFGPWKADRAQLESVLGLWLWSIISMQRIRKLDEKTPSGPDNSIQRASRLIYVLEDSESSDFEPSLKLWLGNHSTALQRAELDLVDTTFYPSTFWVETPRKNVYQRVETSQENEQPTARRIFGSNVIPTDILDDNKVKSLRVLHLPSASSLEMMCAQEIFAIFFNTITPEIEEIRGNTEIVEGPHRFYVANSTLSEMAESFVSSGIANHDDAIACMVPVLHAAEQLNHSNAFMAVRAAGENYRQRKEWTKAENVLLPALKLALQDFEFVSVVHLPGDTERTAELFLCMLSLCELYRWALLSDKRTRLFGLRGLISLFKLFHGQRHLWTSDTVIEPGEVPGDLLAYRNVALSLCEVETNNGDLIQAVKQLREQSEKENIKIVENFHDALHQGDLEGVLYALKPGIIDSCIGTPVLGIATQHALYPIFKSLKGLGIDTREVDHNGLNYLHHAARSCKGSIFKDLVGDDRDLLDYQDNFGRTPLHLAAEAGQTDIVMLLVRHFSVKVDIRDKSFKSPLDNSILLDRVETFAILCKFEEELNGEMHFEEPWDLETARLFEAACCGSSMVFVRLLGIIIDSNSIQRLYPIRDTLREHKGTLESKTDSSSQVFIKVLELLREKGYCADKWQIEGRTGLSFAAEANNPELITYLLRTCTDESIKCVDSSGKNCLHYAMILQSQSAANVLMSSAYFVHLLARDNDRLIPLWYALKDRPFVMWVEHFRTASDCHHNILPGTSIAAKSHCLYSQVMDSRIRVALYNENLNKPEFDGVLSSSARLFTPLAVIGHSKEHCLYYVSEEDILSNLCYTKGRWRVGTLQKNAILVGKRSSLNVCHFNGKAFLFYQDKDNCIRVVITEKRTFIPTAAIGIATEGSDITAIAKTDNLFVYFQNRYGQVEEVTIIPVLDTLGSRPTVGITTKTLPLREPNLELQTPLIWCTWGMFRNSFLCRDNKGHIRIFKSDSTRFESFSFPTIGIPQSRIALTEKRKLYFQSERGEICHLEFEAGVERLKFIPKVAKESKRVPEIEVLCDADSPPLTPPVEPSTQ